METKPILIVDDEKNIRLTMQQSLEPLGIPLRTAVNGEEALKLLKEESYALVFLDLKMPGIDGIEVLRHITNTWPQNRVVIITAHGTIESAVEAMKLGAVDFIQKPFSPGEIRDLATLVLERETLDETNAVDYASLIQLGKRHITDRDFGTASKMIRKAIAEAPDQPEAYNLLGALLEIRGEKSEALKFYRAALDVDPSFKPAWANLDRATSWLAQGSIDLGNNERPDGASGEREGEHEADHEE